MTLLGCAQPGCGTAWLGGEGQRLIGSAGESAVLSSPAGSEPLCGSISTAACGSYGVSGRLGTALLVLEEKPVSVLTRPTAVDEG